MTFRDPADDECFAVVKGYLNKCLQNHPACQEVDGPHAWQLRTTKEVRVRQSPSVSWPARTIDVGPSDGF